MSWNFIKLFSIAFCFTQISSLEDNIPRIQTPYGGLRGSYKTSLKGRTYKAFTCIPFALPPVGNRRFEPPEPVKPWIDEFDATKDSKICLQQDYLTHAIMGVEDCLYMNIYVPEVNNSPLLPVIFWIHGGGFQSGSNREFKPTYLMDKDVIVVMVNYRLAAFGFLSTGDKVVPGNMALKDQSMALRWVSENIYYFGGDPKRITLLGSSAGAISVHFHYFSSLSAGLFQNGISLSGTATGLLSVTKKSAEHSVQLAKILNCASDNTLEIVHCLKVQQPLDILRASNTLTETTNTTHKGKIPLFRPVIENVTQGYFINEYPEQILKKGNASDVPWITGDVSEEGILFTFDFILNADLLKDMDKNWDSLGPALLGLRGYMPEDKAVEITRAARQHYAGEAPFEVNNSTFKSLVHMTGDLLFVYEAQRAATLQSLYNKKPVQVYLYSYRANQSLSESVFNSTKNYGVCHADDTFMVLDDSTRIDPTKTLNDTIVMQRMLHMWYTYSEKNDADAGVMWPKVNATSKFLQYLHIGGPNEVYIKTTDNFGRKQFWDTMLTK